MSKHEHDAEAGLAHFKVISREDCSKLRTVCFIADMGYSSWDRDQNTGLRGGCMPILQAVEWHRRAKRRSEASEFVSNQLAVRQSLTER